MSRQQDYITSARREAANLYNALLELEKLQSEWNALDYGNALPDGAGANDGITAVSVGAVIFDTANAMRGVLDQGHATNLARLL